MRKAMFARSRTKVRTKRTVAGLPTFLALDVETNTILLSINIYVSTTSHDPVKRAQIHFLIIYVCRLIQSVICRSLSFLLFLRKTAARSSNQHAAAQP